MNPRILLELQQYQEDEDMMRVLLVLAMFALAPGALAQDCLETDRQMAQQYYSTAYQFVSMNQWAEAIPSLEDAVET